MKILALNAGSSSLKACVYAIEENQSSLEALPPLWEARADWSLDPGQAEVRIQAAQGSLLEKRIHIASPKETFDLLLEPLRSATATRDVEAVGHRVVHGGMVFRESTQITPEVRAGIARLVELAPSHNRLELEGIDAVDRILGPDTVQVAVFDTAFHASLSSSAFVYPGPYEWLERGIRRYGFHGISHQYTAERAARILDRDLKSLRLISCHLGNGCSVAAIREGHCVDTTMGFTPLDGLMMGTRSGSVDPGILIYLLRHCGYSVDQLDDVLNHESGLLGVSGISADMRDVLAAMAKGNSRARLAFDLYTHRVRSYVGAMLPSLDGLDALVFTAGVGENCAQVRSAVCEKFGFLGVKLDRGKNSQSQVEGQISAPDSLVRVLVVRTHEEWEIARECFRLVASR
jgi:acetate kinase